jgi:mannose-1-phosphate guanylyltransferase
MIAVLLIGGMATRLMPLSRHLPKSLLPVCDREMLHYQVSQLALAGVNRIVLAAGHLVERLEEYTDSYTGGLEFHFSIEDEPRGTAGAIAHARDYIGDDSAVVLNADILTNVDLAQVISAHQQARRPATLVGYKVDDPSRYGLLRTSGDAITGFSEKPEAHFEDGAHFINAGIYVLEPEVIAGIPTGRPVSIEREVFPRLIAEHGELTHFPHEQMWYDIGTFESYFAANFALLAARYSGGEFTLWGERDDAAIFKDMVYINKSANLGSKVDLYHRVIVMRDVQVGDNCRLQNTLLLPGASIGSDCQVADCIIGPGCIVPPGTQLRSSLLVAGEERVPFYPEAKQAG